MHAARSIMPKADPPALQASQPSTWSTHGAFAMLMMASCAAVVLLFFVLWRIYDPNTRISHGIPNSMAEFIAATYAPTLVASFTGYQNAAYVFVKNPKKNKRLQGAGFFYVVALSGVAAAIFSLVYVGWGVEFEIAKKLTGFAATYWGITVGWTFDKLFRQVAAR